MMPSLGSGEIGLVFHMRIFLCTTQKFWETSVTVTFFKFFNAYMSFSLIRVPWEKNIFKWEWVSQCFHQMRCILETDKVRNRPSLWPWETSSCASADWHRLVCVSLGRQCLPGYAWKLMCLLSVVAVTEWSYCRHLVPWGLEVEGLKCHIKVKWRSLSHVRLFVIPWTVQSMNSPGQNTGVGSLSLLWGDLPDLGIKPRSPALQVDSLPAEPQGKPIKEAVLKSFVFYCAIHSE